MREWLLRTAAPALLIVAEHEAPLRLAVLASPAERQVVLADLARWPAFRAALGEAAGQDSGRVRAWRRQLADDPGGITDAVELLARDLLDLQRAALKFS